MCVCTEILNQGLGLMLTGMGTVFSFLIVLWGSVCVMGSVVGKLNEIFPEPVAIAKTAVRTVSDDTEIAIAVAMAKLRNNS